MKLLRFDLEAFGPFTDETLELEAGSDGLHLIFGPNEAGKSSALRALQQLLFGIPERSSDAFLHPYERLRIGGRIQHSDGSVLDFVRRKARTKSLTMRDGQPCTAQDLARFLGGVEQALFASMFGINHDVLVAGGAEILRGGGQLGQVLFAAGAGVANLRSIQERLRNEMDELFKPAGRNQKINKAVNELRELQDTIKKQQLPSEEWERHEHALRDALAQKEQLVKELDEKRREQKRLTRLRDALPVIARRQQLLAELADCRDVVLLAADFSEKRRQVQADQRLAEAQAQQARIEVEGLNAKLATLDLDDGLLEQAERIEELYRRLGEYRKGIDDRPRVELFGKNCLHDAKEILRSLGQPAEPEQAERLRLRADEPIAIQDLGQKQQRLLANLDNISEQTLAVQQRLERARGELAALADASDLEELRALASRATKEAAHERELADVQSQLHKAETQAEQELARLPFWKGTLDDLLTAATPSAETVDRFDAELKAAMARVQDLGRQLQEKEADLAELDNRARQLELEHDVPGEQDLRKARQRRDAGWQLVRRAWLDAAQDRAAIAEFTDNQTDLPTAYERSVHDADHVSDRLRREAERVASKASLLGQREQRLQQREQIAATVAEAKHALAALQEQWANEWRPWNITPRSPHEMRAWLRKQNELVRLAQTCQELRDRGAVLQQSRSIHINKLSECLATLAMPVPQADSLQRLLEHVERIVGQNDERGARGRELHRDIAEREHDERRLKAERKKADDELAAWRAQWGKHMTRLGLGHEATPAQANTVLTKIGELFHKLHEADGFRRRIDGIDRDMRKFAADVHAVARSVAADLLDTPDNAAPAVEQLYQRLKRARAVSQESAALTAQRRQQQERLERTQQIILEKTALLQTLCAEANCTTPGELPTVEERSNRRRRLEEDLRQLHEHLQPLLAGCTLDEFLTQASRIVPDGLDADLARLAEDCERREKNKEELDNNIGAERRELELMDGNALAAESAELAENLVAGIETDAQQFILLRMAAGVLQKGIERYRERNQGPVLSRASRIFADLTLGSFEGLQVDYNDKDEAILTGVRGRQSVGVEGMSDGSRDQLYLALRIASLETYLASHEPIPFIVDDILLNFDDERSLAALQVLAELSKKTQIVFFTHHQHLVELARTNLDEGTLFVHQLRCRQPAAALFEME